MTDPKTLEEGRAYYIYWAQHYLNARNISWVVAIFAGLTLAYRDDSTIRDLVLLASLVVMVYMSELRTKATIQMMRGGIWIKQKEEENEDLARN